MSSEDFTFRSEIVRVVVPFWLLSDLKILLLVNVSHVVLVLSCYRYS